MNLASQVDRVLLMMSLTVSRDPVLVPQSPRKVIVLPPIVMQVWLGSSLVGLTSHTTLVTVEPKPDP